MQSTPQAERQRWQLEAEPASPAGRQQHLLRLCPSPTATAVVPHHHHRQPQRGLDLKLGAHPPLSHSGKRISGQVGVLLSEE